MRKFAKKIAVGIVACITILAVSGCSSAETAEKKEDQFAYLKKLEDGNFYVRHSDHKCEELLWTNSTFDQNSTASSPNDKRVVWFDESTYNKIPTLYEGDSLIYKTSDVLTETFVYERFEDFGYSVGLCGLSETESGRYSISTDPDKNNTFPDGDTDELLRLKNKTVIIDTIGGTELRAPKKTENGITLGGPLTRAGSISGLEKDKLYTAQIYEGTKLHEYDFTANIRIMASMEVTKDTDFSFESETIINLQIPETFNSGYYMVNGVGLFRYVKGSEFDENTNFNEPNVTDSESDSTSPDSDYPSDTIAPSLPSYEPAESEVDLTEYSFELSETGFVTVYANITGTSESEITVVVLSPSGNRYVMSKVGSSFETTFEVSEIGTYTMQFYNLGSASADVNITYQ